MSDQVQQIKERLNVVDVLSGYIRLNKAGANYKALCPFHNEKTPSFMVSPSRQSWHCFGCAEGGDIFTFIQKIESVEFPEALKILADKAGIVLKYDDPKLRSEKDRAYEICEKATQFFINQLAESPAGKKVTEYLKGRGLQDETIKEWRLGYAPDSWGALMSHLIQKGYKESEIERVGLIIKGERYHDRFRNRLIFPIFDINNRVVAFSGRIMSDIVPSKTERPDSGKYVNSPETILYSKGRILYGLNFSKSEIRKNNQVILVEGQMDALLPWQDGIRNIIATSGTALTEDQLMIIKRLTTNLVLAFDMDEAGFRATKRGIDLAQSEGFDISVLSIPSGKDPADFVKERPGELIRLASDTLPIMKYYFNQVFGKFDANKIEGKKFIAATLLSEIKQLNSSVERSGWLRELSLRLGVSERDLAEEMDKIEIDSSIGAQRDAVITAIASQPKTRKEILSERLLSLLLKKPELVSETVKAVNFLLSDDFEILGAIASKDNFSDARSVLPQNLRSRLDFLYLMSDYEIEKLGADFDLEEEIIFLTKEIEREHYKESLQKIGQEIRKCESTEGSNLDTLVKEFQNVTQKLYKLYEKEKIEKK